MRLWTSGYGIDHDPRVGLTPLILARDPLFYGMASVIAFGLLVGTMLTLGVVPVLYSLFFGIRPAYPASTRLVEASATDWA